MQKIRKFNTFKFREEAKRHYLYNMVNSYSETINRMDSAEINSLYLNKEKAEELHPDYISNSCLFREKMLRMYNRANKLPEGIKTKIYKA